MGSNKYESSIKESEVGNRIQCASVKGSKHQVMGAFGSEDTLLIDLEGDKPGQHKFG